MPRRKVDKRAYRVEQNDPRALAIQEVLEEDLATGARLMLPAYRAYALEHRTLDGYCAAATAAYFHMEHGDPRAAGVQPMQRTHRSSSHWWICRIGEDDDVVIDLTLRRKDKPKFDYARGGPSAFVNAGYKPP